MKAIADTGFLVAFARANDRHHDWAVGLASRVTEPLLTCEGSWPRPRPTCAASRWSSPWSRTD